MNANHDKAFVIRCKMASFPFVSLSIRFRFTSKGSRTRRRKFSLFLIAYGESVYIIGRGDPDAHLMKLDYDNKKSLWVSFMAITAHPLKSAVKIRYI